MTQDEALHLLSARIDGELTPEQDQALEAWLRDNPDGRAIADAFRTQDVEMRRTFGERRQAAARTAERVANQLGPMPAPAGPASPRSRWRHLWSVFPPIAAAAALAFVGITWLQPNAPGVSPPANIEVAHNPTANLTSYPDLLVPKAKPVAPETAVAVVNQTIKTEAGKPLRQMLPDGSTLYLDQNTEVKLAADRQLRLESGRIFVDVVSATEDPAKGPFVVKTDKRKIEAVGTKLAVTCNKAADTVHVINGVVKFEGADQPVYAGQVCTTSGAKARIEPAPRAAHELGWARELMVAAEAPLVPQGKYDGGALVAVDPYGQEAKLSMVKYHVDIHIEDGFARTTIDQCYFNHENMQMEGTFYFPLPPDASLSRLAMYVADGENCNLMEGGMAERDIARQTYEKIRHARKDPALLEWVDGSLFKMRVFPLEPRQEKRLILSYSQKLPVSYGKTTYRFPAGHSLNFVDKWSFAARVKNGEAMQAASPSHPAMKIEKKDGDLLLKDAADHAKVDRDVVIELTDPKAVAGESVRWSCADFEGAKYLMLRYKPELPAQPQRERRDWVVLFEASGARDPLVARAQIEIIRSLLNNAEHDDTFTLLTVGTHVHKYSHEPQRVTTANVQKAVEYLEKTHLIGALNIEQALIDAEPLLKTGANPHLVHVGGGVATLGEQRSDKLVTRIPQGTRYVGIAVGKRFSRAFMKSAAEKTGGYFTQINPDEPISWKGFELASTLNTQRLLNIRVDDAAAVVPPTDGKPLPPPVDAGEDVHFLTFSNALSQGEELAAVTRITERVPALVKVHGTLNGVSYEKTIPVGNVAPNAEYLPRTWAKLEIDRLLAEDAMAYRQKITELSKSMYVMTPFTSLLVLENEAMYKEHNIDRGRKDHWAMYACPAKIPVVYIPDPNKPLASNAPELREQKPHANQVMQTILVRTPLRYLAWSERNRDDNKVVTAGQRFGGAMAIPVFDDTVSAGLMDAEARPAEVEPLRKKTPEELFADGGLKRGHSLDFAYRLRGDSQKANQQMLDIDLPRTVSETPDNRQFYSRIGKVNINMLVDNAEPLMFDKEHFSSIPARPESSSKVGQISINGAPDFRSLMTLYSSKGMSSLLSETYSGRSSSTRAKLQMSGSGLALHSPVGGELPAPAFDTDGEELSAKALGALVYDVMPAQRIDKVLSDQTAGPRYYSRPSFSDQNRVFTDLVAYAPGMRSSYADMLAAIQAEAAPRAGLRKGSIDPEARKRIESSRNPEWRTTNFNDETGAVAFTIHHDLQGRYAYERKFDLGLIEKVVCDGVNLWHLYPELGIGAKRTVSCFHRADWCNLIPDMLPPADDLSWGADVKSLDANSVAIVPLQPLGVEKAPTDQKHVELHLVFDGNRLAERKWLLMPEKKVLGREVYEPAGAIVALDKEGKEKDRDRRDRKKSGAVNVTPDVSQLVILPLPLRSREITYRKFDMNPNEGLHTGSNACFEYLSAENSLELLATEFGHDDSSRLLDIAWHCFLKKGDRRVGFFTLLQSYNHHPWQEDAFQDVLGKMVEQNQVSPLMRYLALANDGRAVWMQQQFGLLPGKQSSNDFLSNLLAFRMIAARWQGNAINDSLLGVRDSERRRALAFVRQHAGDVWGWCMLGIVADKAQDNEFRKQIADCWGLLADKSGLKYHGRYEQAVNLANADEKAAARDKFQTLFNDAFSKGVLPPIDHRFREALRSEAWTKLMHDTAAKCLEKEHRSAVVMLAWQCRQLGDSALADDLLERALKDPADDVERVAVMLAAIEYLWSIQSFEHADRLVGTLAAMPQLQKQPRVWRLAAKLAEKRGRTLRQFECLEMALDREYAKMPEVFSVEPVRNDYRSLLNHYQWLAEASRSLDVEPPADLVPRTIKAADRWRSLDPEVTEACDTAAKILRTVGGKDAEVLAWDYLTTPLALKPNESDSWLGLAASATREGDLELADRCYEAAFAAEPTNAQILWDRAKLLERRGEIARSRALMEKLSTTEWQPRFEGLKSQAEFTLHGK